MNFSYNFDIELREFAHKLDVDDETKSEIKKWPRFQAEAMAR